MSRLELAYLLIALLVGAMTTMAVLSYRYVQYQRAIRHGRRDHRPVWQPFWMN